MTAYPTQPRAFYARGGPRRRYSRADRARPDERPLPADPTLAAAAQCPGAILDSSPDGTGLGVWVLVEQTSDECIYEYGGGIA